MRSQSGSPNSQKLPPIVYMPAAAMLTEQNPPCAAKFGVPNCVAQNPVSDWLWSRPVKKASFFGSSARIFASQDSAVAIASSHSISRNSPAPRSPTRSSGLVNLRRRILLHDAGGALAADHAAIDRVLRIALDVADAAVLQMHFDAAAAGAHVAGRVFDLVGDARRGIDLLPRRPVVPPTFEKTHPDQGSFGFAAVGPRRRRGVAALVSRRRFRAGFVGFCFGQRRGAVHRQTGLPVEARRAGVKRDRNPVERAFQANSRLPIGSTALSSFAVAGFHNDFVIA